jgi:hypothetical protein
MKKTLKLKNIKWGLPLPIGHCQWSSTRWGKWSSGSVSAYVWNKQLRTADMRLSSSLGTGRGEQLFTKEDAVSYKKLHWLQQEPQKEETACLTTMGNAKGSFTLSLSKSRSSTPFLQATSSITMFTGVWHQALTWASWKQLTPASYHHIYPHIWIFFFLIIIWRMGGHLLITAQKTKTYSL